MLKKLAKLLGNAKNGLHSTPGSNPTPPPPPLYQHSYSMNNGTMQKNNQQQKQQQLTFNPYVDEMEDDTDNMSLYSTTASIMTSRNHPRNNSQRPLLGERKPQLLLQLSSSNNNSNNSSNNNKNITGGNVKKYKYHTTTTANQQQPCPKYQQRKAHQQEQQLQQQQLEASYISPYVQQQKRDSAKGLHGFNDFDILSQQYNTHLQSPHIGYPYGSPPSPHSSNVDFVFDTVESAARITTTTTTLTTKTAATTTTTASKSTHFGTVNNYGSMLMSEVNAVDYIAASDAISKFSRFEDDFCNRRNMKFAANDVKCNEILVTDENRQTIQTGPFIFGIPPEQQTNPTRSPNHDDDCINVTQTDNANNHSPKDTHAKFNSWDTSSPAPDNASSGSNDSSTRERKSVRKFLLKKFCKKKKTTKAHILSKLIDKASIKCVVVGDCAVGKTNLILSYLENRFNVEHVPTASDIYNADVMVDDNPVHLTLCDTAGQDTLDPLRELCYPDSDVFLLCFSVAKPDTFHAIKTKWAPKFAKTKAALILVGTQADLRHNANVLNKLQSNGEKPILYADAWDLATTIGAKYIETSSATQYKVKEVFDTAIWDGLVPEALPAPPPSLWKKLFCLA